MAILGIDGNMWYVSNGLCLGDPRANFVFAETPRKAFDEWNRKNPREHDSGYKHAPYMDMTSYEYRKQDRANQCGVCGDYHDKTEVPLFCQTGDGA